MGWAIRSRLAFAGMVLVAGCGGSVTSIQSGDGGREAGPPRAHDGGTEASSTDGSLGGDASRSGLSDGATGDGGVPARAYDGTTGKACTTDADCQAAGGPGAARCSNSVFAPDDFYPTPVCILPTCTSVSGPTALHYCDGPDDPSSPGMCVPWGSTGAGICLPKCSFDTSGAPATGCQGKDTCFAYSAAVEGGHGYCWAGCTADGDCPSGQRCQTDRGTCQAKVVVPTKPVGAACTVLDSDNFACHCFYGGAEKTGYCSTFCATSGSSSCPDGYVCDAVEYRDDGYTQQNPGMGGYCVAQCGTTDSGSGCPANATCSNINAAGPDCVP